VHHGQSNDPRPLITVCASGNVSNIYGCPATSRQPITVRPVVGRGPDGTGQAIYFGTGKFYEDGDNVVTAGATGPVQSFYAVFDDNASNRQVVAGRSELLQQSILGEATVSNQGSFRVTSNNDLTTSHKGWYIDLIYSAAGFKGERVVADPVLQGGRIIFTTLMPGDACTGGSDGWLMELQARDGARFSSPVLDLNGDGKFTESTPTAPGDTVIHGGQQISPSGLKSTVGGLQTPSIINVPGQGLQKKIMSGATGNLQQVGERDTVARGRTSWRQFWP
jgi:type IV pilus assembly protein PilY1